MGGERVRVSLIDPKGELRVSEATTDPNGGFLAHFDLTSKPSVDAHKPPQKQPLVHGAYKAQAFTINSPNAAEGASNVIVITR